MSKAALLPSRRSNILATPPAETGTWYSTILKCRSCGDRSGGGKPTDPTAGPQEDEGAGAVVPSESYCLVVTSVSPLGVLVGLVTGGAQLNCKPGGSRVAIAFSCSRCAVLIHAEIGLQTMDGICDSVTLVLQLLSYWKYLQHLNTH